MLFRSGSKSGYDATQKLLTRHPELTAIFSCSEEMTVGAMQYLYESGLRVPDDISIVSFDSVDRCNELYPPVTSVCFPINDMAQSAVQVLMDLTAGKEVSKINKFTPKLVVRKADSPLM